MEATDIENINAYATVDQLNSLRDLLMKAKEEFNFMLEDIKKSHKVELDEKDKVIYKLQTRSEHLVGRHKVAECRIDEQSVLINDLEQYSRRHSLRLNGIEIKYNENVEDFLTSVQKEIKIKFAYSRNRN